MAIWYNARPFGVVCGDLVYFSPFWFVLTKKNLATLASQSMSCRIVRRFRKFSKSRRQMVWSEKNDYACRLSNRPSSSILSARHWTAPCIIFTRKHSPISNNLGVLFPREEYSPIRSPPGLNIISCSEEWRGKQRISPQGIISLLGDNFAPGGQSLPSQSWRLALV
jgi:hypothetical protein